VAEADVAGARSEAEMTGKCSVATTEPLHH